MQAWLGERPLRDLQYRRHVHQDRQKNWQDQKHLHKEIQEGTQGDEIRQFLPYTAVYHIPSGHFVRFPVFQH